MSNLKKKYGAPLTRGWEVLRTGCSTAGFGGAEAGGSGTPRSSPIAKRGFSPRGRVVPHPSSPLQAHGGTLREASSRLSWGSAVRVTAALTCAFAVQAVKSLRGRRLLLLPCRGVAWRGGAWRGMGGAGPWRGRGRGRGLDLKSLTEPALRPQARHDGSHARVQSRLTHGARPATSVPPARGEDDHDEAPAPRDGDRRASLTLSTSRESCSTDAPSRWGPEGLAGNGKGRHSSGHWGATRSAAGAPLRAGRDALTHWGERAARRRRDTPALPPRGWGDFSRDSRRGVQAREPAAWEAGAGDQKWARALHQCFLHTTAGRAGEVRGPRAEWGEWPGSPGTWA